MSPESGRLPDASLLAAMPKVELHLHLEGAIPIESLWTLVQKYGDARVVSLDQLRARFEYKDFAHFIDTWNWKNGFLREYEDFTFIAESIAQDLHRQNIRYAEAFFSPPDFRHHGLTTGRITEAIRTGLNRLEDRIEVRLIGDVVRDAGVDSAERTVRELAETRSLGVIGIGMGGSEQSYPPEPFSPVFALARELGFHTTAHAGEAAGSESIWGALRSLEVERIGHGTRAQEDPRLVEYLVSHQIPIECCPISNTRTGVVTSIEHHPIRDYFAKGLKVSVNTDDPSMFNTDLVSEFLALMSSMNFGLADIIALARNAIESSWATDERRQGLLDELEGFARARAPSSP